MLGALTISRLLQKMKDTPEGAGTLLDNSVVIFLPEAGHGTQLNDGVSAHATHSVEDMVMIVGGRAGGLAPGRHVATGGAHPGQALVPDRLLGGPDYRVGVGSQLRRS